MRRAFLIPGFCLLTSLSVAQAPGYVGKKFSVYYESSFFLSRQHNAAGRHDYGVNIRSNISLDYVASKSVALGGSFQYMSTKLNDAFYMGAGEDPFIEHAFYGDVKLRGPAVSLYVKTFHFRKKGYLAPIGTYSKFELLYGRVKGKTGEVLSRFDSYYVYQKKFENLGYADVPIYGFLYTFGRQSLFYDRLFINTSSSIGFFPPGIGAVFGDNNGYYYGHESDFIRDSNNRLAGYFLFNFNLGLGVLIF